MGNRGILHDRDRRIVRYAQGRRWIACLTSFRGRRRPLMRPGAYTELFFLDEATALAAGHRPCAECRYADYQRFRTAWAAWHGGDTISAESIDRRLHEDRLAGSRVKRRYAAPISSLPDGSYVERDGAAWLVWDGSLLAWSPSGYTTGCARPETGEVSVLTPRCIVAVIRAGYQPFVHPSACDRARRR